MPKVTKTRAGRTFTSHWLASPNKYMAAEPAGAFAAAFGLELTREGIISPCGECHGGKLSRMKTKAEAKQDGIYADALTVQAALVDSLAAIKAAKDGGGDPVQIAAAAEDHRAAHVRWESLVVSENSMGFHNPSEVGDELRVALSYAQSAKQKAEDAWGPACPNRRSATTASTMTATRLWTAMILTATAIRPALEQTAHSIWIKRPARCTPSADGTRKRGASRGST